MDGLENVFEEDLGLETPDPINVESVFEEPVPLEGIFDEPRSESELINELLKAKGIIDSKIVIIDEENNEQTVDFYSLTKDEQLEILNGEEPENAPITGLQNEEEELIAYLRENNLSLQEYLKLYEQSIVDKIEENSVVSYDIDAYDDQELFLLDLKSRYDDLTDEELVKELQKELQDIDLFNKKVTKLRSDYKQLEDTYKEEQQKEILAKNDADYNQYVDTMVDVAVKNEDLYGIMLEDDEKNNVLSFLLELDESGTSNFYKALDNPENLYRAAWFLTYGQQAFDAIKDAYETEISKIKKDKPKVIVKSDALKNINDLFN